MNANRQENIIRNWKSHKCANIFSGVARQSPKNIVLGTSFFIYYISFAFTFLYIQKCPPNNSMGKYYLPETVTPSKATHGKTQEPSSAVSFDISVIFSSI